MSDFIDTRFPLEIAYGSGGAETFETDVFTGENLLEVRAERSTDSRAAYDIAMVRPATEIEAVKALFLCAQGQLKTFRHRDPLDWSVTSAHIGTGDATVSTFQLVRPFYSSTWYFNKPVTRPVSTSVSVTLDGVGTTEFTVDSTSGVITMTTVPGSSVIVRASFQYDREVRFAEDELTIGFADGTAVCELRTRLVET